MAEAAVVVAVAVVVTAPSAVIVQNAAQTAATSAAQTAATSATPMAATSATPMALRPVAKGQHAASVQSAANAMWNNAVKVVAARVAAKDAAHAKTATAVDAAKVKLTSTTTPHLKRKPKHEPKHVTSAWPAKNAAKALKAVKEVKAVANAAHAANATTTAANAALA